MQFKDKVIMISGASSGIGKAIAEALLLEGAKISLCARNITNLKEAFANQDSSRILLIMADVSKEPDCMNFVDETLKHWGKIDILINNAGMSMRALFEHVDLQVLHQLMNVNFWGTVYMCKYALPSIIKSKGIILGVSSIAGNRGLPARTGYSSSKFAMQGFLESLRTELLNTGVHVMWVCPGFTQSNIRNTALNTQGNAQQETPLNEQKLMSAETCAKIILNAMIKQKRTVVMTLQGKIAVWLNKLMPGFVDKQVHKLFLKEPNSPLVNYHKQN